MEALLVGAAVLGCCVVVPAVVRVLAALGMKKRRPTEERAQENFIPENAFEEDKER